VAENLGQHTVVLAGVALTEKRLRGWLEAPLSEPLLRVVREDTARAIDLGDLLYLFDDVLAADLAPGTVVDLPTGRARAHGLLLHPDDVYKGRPRQYPRGESLAIDTPPEPGSVTPASDGDPPGPGWTGRFLNPSEREPMLQALAQERPGSDFAGRIRDLVSQLEAQGAEVWLTSTVRSRHRGYLMWGSFALSRCTSESEVQQLVARLEQRNREWGLEVPIAWEHPDGWEATVEAARTMAEAYDVVYATERGARYSSHYGGRAVDVVAYGLPRRLVLSAADGAMKTFDLSDPAQPRDLSLTVEVVRWIEEHHGLSKLTGDYPHWNDSPQPSRPESP
jgi:hypothetical protein